MAAADVTNPESVFGRHSAAAKPPVGSREVRQAPPLAANARARKGLPPGVEAAEATMHLNQPQA